jgi:hypothetical protein
MPDNKQIVYVLTNPSMPGLVKIGKTTQVEIEDRMRQLYSSGVPVPFDCAYACNVKDANEVEKSLHFAFGECRINPNREFFRISPERVIAVLRLLKTDEITGEVEQVMDRDVEKVDHESGEKLKASRRPVMNYETLGMPPGSMLVWYKDDKEAAEVVDGRRVKYRDREMSLTNATRLVMGLDPKYPIQPAPYWLYNGKSIDEIYEEYYAKEED